MPKQVVRAFDGLAALPAFPVILLTSRQNVMAAVSFHYYSTRPVCVQVGVRVDNLTHKLIADSGEFGVNLPTPALMNTVRYVGENSGRKVDKWAETGLTPFPATQIDASLVSECPVNLECRVVHRVGYRGSHEWFIGKVEAAHVDPDHGKGDGLLFWMQEFWQVGDPLLKY